MLTPLAQLGLLVAFAIFGILAGVAQMQAERTCSCCGRLVSRSAERCPHCRCRE